MHTSYTSLAKFYDAMHQRRNYAQESQFVIDQIKKANPAAQSVLDVGCGTGTHLDLMQHTFQTLAGVDLNPEILAVAQEKCPSVTFTSAGMADFKLDQTFDAIISLYSVFNYNLDLAAAEKTLANFHQHLNPGGVIVIALYLAKVLDKTTSIHAGKFGEMESAKINTYQYDPKTKLETSSFVLFWKEDGKVDFTTENDHQFRIFEIEEMNELLKKTGFSPATYFNGYKDESMTAKSAYPVLVATKS